MNFIILHGDADIYVNPEKLSVIFRDEADDGTEFTTVIVDSAEMNVNETPEEILALVEEAN